MSKKFGTRYYTNEILSLIEDGVLDSHTVLVATLNYLSDDDVKDMAELNEFLADYDNEDNDYDYSNEKFSNDDDYDDDDYDKDDDDY